MKEKKTFVYCEHCNKAWEDISPPSKEAYMSGRIEIRNGFMLLPKPTKIHKSRAACFDGLYCNIDCLIRHLKKIMK